MELVSYFLFLQEQMKDIIISVAHEICDVARFKLAPRHVTLES